MAVRTFPGELVRKMGPEISHPVIAAIVGAGTVASMVPRPAPAPRMGRARVRCAGACIAPAVGGKPRVMRLGEAGADSVVRAWAVGGRRLPVRGAATTVWERGSGEPVVCLHGVPASAFVYRKVLRELAARGCRGIAFDLPGLGLAERPAGFDYSWSGLARWVGDALDALGLDRCHLVVHDIGGPIGFEVVARAPERIASLTVLNTMVRVAGFRRPWFMEPFARRGIGELSLRAVRPPALERLLRLKGVATDVPSQELRAYATLLKHGDGGRAFLRIMRGFERTEAFERRVLAALAARSFPAQVLWGEEDPVLALDEHGSDACAALGLDRITRLPGKHFVQEDAPAQIAERVARQAQPARVAPAVGRPAAW